MGLARTTPKMIAEDAESVTACVARAVFSVRSTTESCTTPTSIVQSVLGVQREVSHACLRARADGAGVLCVQR